ncbi:MAG: hypothetical protein HKN01_07330, partial [Acidimicrobiia bacterium]|nr:hypothetical protein [Acidimicrobiia bacterium]
DQLSKHHATALATVAEPDIDRILALSRLSLSELAEADDSLARRAERIVEQRISFTARSNPDSSIVETVGPRPDDRDRASVWDAGIEAAAIYNARWNADARTPVPIEATERQRIEHAEATANLRNARVASLTEQPTADLAAARNELVLEARTTTTEAPTQTRVIEQVADIDAALTPRIQAVVDSPANYITDTLGEPPTERSEPWNSAARAIETYRHAPLGIEPSSGALDRHAAIGPRPSGALAVEAWTSANAALHLTQGRPAGIEH